MNTITKTAAGAAAAAAVAAGVALYSAFDQEPQLDAGYVDDIQPVTVETPKIVVPSVAAATVTAATVSIPSVNSFREIATFDLESLGVPLVQSAAVATPAVTDAAANMPEAVALLKTLLPLIRDRRTLLGSDISSNSTAWQRWAAIYQDAEYTQYVPDYKPLAPGLRIINEVKCPADAAEFATMQSRLDYYAERGYNAVLVTFDTTENLPRLSAAVDYIKSAGFRVVIAYAGREDLREPVWRDPATLRRWLSTLGGKADALLLGWRRTSLHLFLPDRAFTNFLIRSAREGNPDLAVVGMAYYGETAETLQGITYDVPENCSAVLVVGLGYPRASTRTALRTLFPEVADHPHLIGLAVGEKPYFDTQNATGKSRAENEAIQRRIEIRLLQAGCASTMTYSGDGSDGAYGDTTKTENLCREYGGK